VKRQQDQDQVTAAKNAAKAYLAPSVERGTFKGEVKILEMLVKAELLETAPDGGQYLIEKAIAGNAMIDAVLRKVINEKVLADEALPPNLKQYFTNHIMLIDRDAKKVNKGGRPAADFLVRNAVIHRVVNAMKDRGFHLDRNETPRGESARSIVSAALAELDVELDEKSVAKIWRTGIRDQLQLISCPQT
jgi:hypothetical protein